MKGKRIAIIGNGAYGQALAHLFSKKHSVEVFGRSKHSDQEHLIDDFFKFSDQIDYLIFSVTTTAFSSVYENIFQYISGETSVILAMKGLTEDGKLPIDICKKYTPQQHVMVLSGPGFASDILDNVSVNLVLASNHRGSIEYNDFDITGLLIDFSTDIYGVSWCGILKNIYAIGAGVTSKKSEFSRESYTAQVVSEMQRLLVLLGGQTDTSLGPAGKGDIWICTTPQSRNFRYGAGEYAVAPKAEGCRAGKLWFQKFPDTVISGEFPLLTIAINSIIGN